MGGHNNRLKDEKPKKISGYIKTIIILNVLFILLVVPGLFPAFCDWYTDNIYPLISDPISRVTGRIPFALGEILMYIGAVLVMTAIIIAILMIFLRKKQGYIHFAVGYLKTFSIITLFVMIIYMPTWYIPFCGTVLGKGNEDKRTEYSFEEIEGLLIYITDGANKAAEEIEINEDGTVHFRTMEENSVLASQALADLSSEYGRLSGYYPPVKNALCSDILNRMNIGGYNYPFTMEPTRNRYIGPLYQPILDAHEMSHHQGYYKENEANFLSQIALSRSSDPYFRLAAYLDMFRYVYSDYIKARDALTDETLKKAAEEAEPKLSERVEKICEASREEAKKAYDAEAHFIDSFPELDKFIHDTADKGWEVQEDILEDNSYDGVVLLLLQYYYK